MVSNGDGVIKILWVILCVVIAAWGVLGGGDAALVATYLMGLLTMPTGLLIYVLGSLAIKDVHGGHAGTVVVHALVVLAGYFQWFILLPKLVRRMRSEKRPAVWSLVFVGLVIIVYGLYHFYLHVFPISNLS
jgi:hypothetical protein